ncbi:hypothetical protein G7046_g3279 [Stylonectria norvegica]|nr:hypothetical protein G7046_g3279 [Stylonectria norvegica]
MRQEQAKVNRGPDVTTASSSIFELLDTSTTAIMKPVVSAFNAWSWSVNPPISSLSRATANESHCSTVISVFAIVILSIIALLFRSGHEEFVGGITDPDDGKAVAGTIFTAVIVYAVRNIDSHTSAFPTDPSRPIYTSTDSLQAFLVFCGFQGLLHARESRRGTIAL